MKALFIGNDPSLFTPGSPSFLRMRAYAEAIGTLHILQRSDAPDSLYVEGPLSVHGCKARRVRGARTLVAYAHDLIVSEGIEVVSAQDPFEHGWVAREAVKGTNVPLHVQVHTDFLSPWFVRGEIFRGPSITMPVKNRVRMVLADQVLPQAQGIRVVSERIKTSLMRKYGSRIPEPSVLPIAVGTTVPEPMPLPPHAFPFALVTVGRLEPEKRIEDIFEALVRIKDQYPAIGLVVIGDGRERTALMTKVVEKGLTGRVVFAGASDDAWAMMRSGQGYIQASAYEGYGRTLIEAALARVPIITTDVGVVGEVLKGFEDVLAAPPGDPAQLAYHMVALLQDVSARELMVRSAEAKALAHVSAYANLPQLIAADLARLVAPPVPPPPRAMG